MKLFFVFLFIALPVFSESEVTLEQAVKKVMNEHVQVKKMIYEHDRSDSDQLKREAKYSYNVIAEAAIQQSRLPFNQANYFSGTKSQANKYSTGVEKLFSSGTYFKIEAASTRFDNNAFEGPRYATSSFSALGIPPLYTGELKVTMSQDLLKNAFGYSERKENQMQENLTQMKKNEVSMKISQTITEALSDFWNYYIATESFQASKRLYENTKNIRNMYIRKRALGLAESFEINNWNALLSQAESSKEQAKLKMEETKNILYRNLSLDPAKEISFITLKEELAESPDVDNDVAYALKHRADYLNASLLKENAELKKKIASNAQLPEAKLSGSAASQGQSIVSPQENFTGENGATTGKYKTYSANLKISYPLFDPGRESLNKEAEILLKQSLLEEERAKREVIDSVKQQIQTLETSHRIFLNTQKAETEMKRYYNGIYGKFQGGKYDATTIKNALDSLIQSEMNTIQAKVNYNINLMRYYIAKNSLFEKFSINPDDYHKIQ